MHDFLRKSNSFSAEEFWYQFLNILKDFAEKHEGNPFVPQCLIATNDILN